MPAPFLLILLFAQQGGAGPSQDPAKAVVRLQEQIRANPSIESNYTELGNLLLATQNFQEAVLVLENARSHFPSSVQAALSLGVAYYGLRRFPDAVSTLLEASRLDTAVEQPIAFLVRMPEHWGERRPDVIAAFTRFSQKNPKSAVGHYAVGSATKNPQELRTALRLDPSNAGAHMELGSLQESQRDFQGAIDSFSRAAKLSPGNPVPHYRLSRLYTRTGETDKAESERVLHEKLADEQKAELDRRQGAAQHMKMTVRP